MENGWTWFVALLAFVVAVLFFAGVQSSIDDDAVKDGRTSIHGHTFIMERP